MAPKSAIWCLSLAVLTLQANFQCATFFGLVTPNAMNGGSTKGVNAKDETDSIDFNRWFYRWPSRFRNNEQPQLDCISSCLPSSAQMLQLLYDDPRLELTDQGTFTPPQSIDLLRFCLEEKSDLDYCNLILTCVYERCLGGEEEETMDSREERSPRRKTINRPEPDMEGNPGSDATTNDREILRRWKSFAKLNSPKKRGYTDVTDVCIAFHCSNKPRGTFGFLKCVSDNRCSGRR